MNKIKLLSLAIAGMMAAPVSNIVNAAPQKGYVNPQLVADEMMQLNAAPLKDPRHSNSKDVWSRLRSGFSMAEVNPELVRKHEQYYASRAQYFNRTLARGSKYLYFITEEVERRNMPTEVAILPIIESAFVTKAKSPVGASGLWQFMPATGKDFGLTQSSWYDGRHDVYESTYAALDYLEKLHNMFGDWSLAFASYNWGQGNVGRAVKRAQAAGLAPTYENLNMPLETRNYVPKLLAVRNIIDNPEKFNLSLAPLPNKPYFEAIPVNKSIDTALAANFAEISLDEFYALNPAFNLPVYSEQYGGARLLIPAEKVATFHKNMRKWGNKSLVSWDIYTAQRGDTVASLASQTGMNSADLRDLNNLKGNALQAGRVVLVAKNSGAPVTPNFTAPQVLPDMVMIAQATPSKAVSTPVVKLNSGSDVTILARNTIVPSQPKVVIENKVMTPAPVVVAKAEPKVQPTAVPERIVVTSLTNQSTPEMIKIAQPTFGQVAISEDKLKSFVETLATNTQEPLPTSTPVQQNIVLAQNDVALTPILDDDARRRADEQLNQSISNWNKEVAQAKQQAQEIKLAEAKAAVPETVVAKNGTYKVQAGDTLYQVARIHDMNIQDIKKLNNLSDDNIVVGRILQVSGSVKNTGAKVMTASNTKAKKASPKETVYTVQKGDSWYKVAQKYGVDHKELMKMNTKADTDGLKPGQKIKVRLIDL